MSGRLGEMAGRVDIVLHYETPPTVTTIVYNISLNGPLPKSGGIPDDEQCIDGTWVCMTKRERHLGRDPVPSGGGAQVLPIVMEAPQSDSGPDSMGDREDFGVYSQLRETAKDKTPSLSLHMRGGHYMDIPQRVQMKFQCAESDDDVPRFSGYRNGTHTFTWSTKHACTQVYQTLQENNEEPVPPPADEDKDPNAPPSDIEEPPLNQDLISSPITPPQGGPLIATIILCSGAVLLGLGYLALRPPAVLQRYLNAIRGARLLRGVGETKLLRWAAEDLEMPELGDEDEEDEMVNSRPLVDEEIPLRPSRTRLSFVDYGAAH
ncbi:hypothetical protein BGW80DRAFT_1251001 [Lactifluus volemus]|nr:hypothetical protein BGW80DRAFT_1251001 [Lactifluus volemus]